MFWNCLYTTCLHSVATDWETFSSRFKTPQMPGAIYFTSGGDTTTFKTASGTLRRGPEPAVRGYLDVAGDLVGQRHVQHDQGLLGARTVRKEVTPPVRPDASFHIHPVFHRMHGLRPGGKSERSKPGGQLARHATTADSCAYCQGSLGGSLSEAQSSLQSIRPSHAASTDLPGKFKENRFNVKQRWLRRRAANDPRTHRLPPTS